MKVYVVLERDAEESTIRGVFSAFTKAMELVAYLTDKNGRNDAEVIEFTLDEVDMPPLHTLYRCRLRTQDGIVKGEWSERVDSLTHWCARKTCTYWESHGTSFESAEDARRIAFEMREAWVEAAKNPPEGKTAEDVLVTAEDAKE